MADLFEKIGWVNRILELVAYLVVVVAAGTILASLYNTMNERRREFAILRSLGARRSTVFSAIVPEVVPREQLGSAMALNGISMNLPRVVGPVVAGAILVFIPATGQFVVPDLLGGAKTAMLGNAIQLQFGPSRDWPFGSAIAFTGMAIVLVGLFLYARSASNRQDGLI